MFTFVDSLSHREQVVADASDKLVAQQIDRLHKQNEANVLGAASSSASLCDIPVSQESPLKASPGIKKEPAGKKQPVAKNVGRKKAERSVKKEKDSEQSSNIGKKGRPSRDAWTLLRLGLVELGKAGADADKFWGPVWKTPTSRNWYNYYNDIMIMLRDAEDQSHIDELTLISKQVVEHSRSSSGSRISSRRRRSKACNASAWLSCLHCP